MDITDFLVGPLLSRLPTVFTATILALAAFFYFHGNSRAVFKLVTGTILFRVFYVVFLTTGQYYVWSNNEFTKTLLNSPVDKNIPATNDIPGFFFDNQLGYFLFYSWGRFWLNLVIVLAVSFVFYLFLKFLKRYKERFFKPYETELGFLTALLVGWPNFVIFVPLVFLSVVVISLFRLVLLKELYTTLGVPFIVSAALTLVWGGQLVKILGLGILKV